MAHPGDPDDEGSIADLVHDTVVADAQSVGVDPTQLLRAARARLLRDVRGRGDAGGLGGAAQADGCDRGCNVPP